MAMWVLKKFVLTVPDGECFPIFEDDVYRQGILVHRFSQKGRAIEFFNSHTTLRQASDWITLSIRCVPRVAIDALPLRAAKTVHPGRIIRRIRPFAFAIAIAIILFKERGA